MIKYLKTKKNFLNKLKKNGEKEYHKKNIIKKNKTKKNKRKKNKKMIGRGKPSNLNSSPFSFPRPPPSSPIPPPSPIPTPSPIPPLFPTPSLPIYQPPTSTPEPIEQSDIMYQDDLVCILKPDVKKGILVWSHYTQPPEMDSLCNLGLKTGQQLQSEGVEFGRTTIHPYIFFRAPYYSRDINYTSVETEITSSYGQVQLNSKVFIRVDPNRTFVFSSELRAKNPRDINKSKKLMLYYLEIIARNAEIYKTLSPIYATKKTPAYNLYSSVLTPIPNDGISPPIIPYPFDEAPIERNSEILVSIPHLTPDFFVLCTS
jgi:hypothetical protein